MRILLLNAGSSSLKATLVTSADGTVLAHGLADWAGSSTRYAYTGTDGRTKSNGVNGTGHAWAVKQFVRDLKESEPQALKDVSELAAVGHRVVHGGPFTHAVRIGPEVRQQIASLVDVAPLHNPPSLATLAAAESELPGVPQVAVFDTTFHATLPPEACTYPIPAKWTSEWGLRRYGFHGLSYAYCADRAAQLLERPKAALRLVICHLGHGCSAAAVKGGRCIDTTMGFTPLEGLMMGTRSGSVDPGLLLHVMQHHGLTAEEVETALNRESGLLGVSGLSPDMREILASQPSNPRALLALKIYAHRVRQAIGALTVTLGGLDALVFTAGVGEHAAEVRESVCAGLECLNVYLDTELNAACRPDADVARAASRVRVLVIATREDVTMLNEVLRVLDRQPPRTGDAGHE